ncbi:unnamed protein product [Durusdinium trenchii]
MPPHLAVIPGPVPVDGTTVVLGAERLAVDRIYRDSASFTADSLVASAREGISHGLILLGPKQKSCKLQTSEALDGHLLQSMADALVTEDLQVWLSAVEILDDQILDLLATGAPSDRKEAPMLVAHPSLGTQLLGAVEAPLREPSDLRELMSFILKRRCLTQTCLHGSRSHPIYLLRTEIRSELSVHLALFDLRGPVQGPSDFTALEHLIDLGAPESMFRASLLTTALKDSIVGSWHSTILATLEPEVADCTKQLRLLSKWARLPFASPRRASARVAQLAELREEVRELQAQHAMDDARATILADRSAMILEFSKAHDPPKEWKKLRRERDKTLDWCGLPTSDAEEALDLMTPYLLNMSDDPALCGRLMYLLPKGERTCIGSDPDNSVVVDGLGILPNLCSIVNVDDFKLTLSRPDFARRHVLINGKTMAKESMVLSHHDRICLGRAQIFRLQIPHMGVETIQEEEETLARMQRLECLLPEELTGFLPSLPRQSFDTTFENLQHLLDHSDALRNLQYYIKDLLPRLPAASALAYFEALRKVCYCVDEANMITREVRPDDHLHLEVELVWDIFRPPEEAILIRLMRYCKSDDGPATGQVVHYWSYACFLERLELMRDVHRVHCHARNGWAGANEMLQDPWMEPNLFPLRDVLSHALAQRSLAELQAVRQQPVEPPDSERRAAEAALQELQEKTEQLERQAEIISQLKEQIMGVVSLTRELQEEPGDTVDPPEPAEPARVGEENFTMSVSSSTFSDGVPTGGQVDEDVRSRGFRVDKLSNTLLQSLAPALLSQSSLTPPHCYRDLNR